MKRNITILLALTLCVSGIFGCSETEKSTLFSDYVNPNIGTAHSRWFFYTPAAVPFGMAKLGPTTDAHLGNANGWEAVGYDDRHSSIEGFAHFHEFQVGGVVLMPTTGDVITVPGSVDDINSGYRSGFNKSNEIAKPGYYSVLLDKYNVEAELTATKRVGFHRYTFPDKAKSNIIFDIGHQQGESGEVLDAAVTYNDGVVSGFVETKPKYVEKYQSDASVKMFFYAKLNRLPKDVGVFIDNKIDSDATTVNGKGSGLYITYESDRSFTVEVKMGLSFTSIESAEENLDIEAGDMDFSSAKIAAHKVWEENLGRIAVEGDSLDMTKFYTGLYHSLLGRGVASDNNGSYPKNDGTVGQIELGEDGKPVHNLYNTDAIWGAFWNLTQLWHLAWPEYYSDYVKSQLLVYRDAGWLGDGIACSKYVSGVGSNFQSLIIAAAYNCGIRDFDVELAYEAVRKDGLEWDNRPKGAGKKDIRSFVETGYIPYISRGDDSDLGSRFSTSRTMEYGFGSFAAASFAKQLNRPDDYKQFMKLSKAWERVYDDESNFVRPVDADCKFLEPFDPYAPWVGFQEGNAWQYTFYVPQSPCSVVDRMGQETFNARLDDVFISSSKVAFGSNGDSVDAFSGLKNKYNHGNQPSLYIPWLYNFSQEPWKTQYWNREICDKFYGTEVIHGYGYGQDEDQGQLGAWFVMASMGIFDVQGGTPIRPTFQFATPLFDKITIKLNPDYAKGELLVINVEGRTDKNRYIQSFSHNDKLESNLWLYRDEMLSGGKIDIVLGESPNKSLGLVAAPVE